ncbi:hypothetical protein EBR21_17350, partial [bacterium]|nr:hypothetical protein [bacterium]
SLSQQYTNRPVQQYGNGDAIKILLKERAAQSEISSSTIPICSPDSNTPPAGRKFDEVIIGQTEENVKSQGLGKKFLVSTESRSLLEKAQSAKDEDKSALLFVGQREIVMPQFLFDALKSKSSQALTKLVTVVQDEDLNFWRNSPQQSDGFSLSARQGGVGAGDSGSPIIRVETELPSPGRETLELAPYVSKMTCLKGIVVRENLDNKLSLHSDTDGDPSGKISSSAITQEVDNPKRWAQIYPVDQRTFVQTRARPLTAIARIRTFVGSRVLQSLEKPNQGCVSQSGSCPLRAPFLDARRLTALNDARQYVSSLNPDLRNLEFDACIAQLASLIKSAAFTIECQRFIGDRPADVLIQFNLKP